MIEVAAASLVLAWCQAGVDSGAVTLIQRFGSAASLNIHLHCPALDGMYRCGADELPVFVESPAPADEALQAVSHKIITGLMKLLTRREDVGRRGGFDLHSRHRWPGRGLHAQAAGVRRVYIPNRLRPSRRPEGADAAGRHAQGGGLQSDAATTSHPIHWACRCRQITSLHGPAS